MVSIKSKAWRALLNHVIYAAPHVHHCTSTWLPEKIICVQSLLLWVVCDNGLRRWMCVTPSACFCIYPCIMFVFLQRGSFVEPCVRCFAQTPQTALGINTKSQPTMKSSTQSLCRGAVLKKESHTLHHACCPPWEIKIDQPL